ncbi:MAG: lamin tail domain-containing protein [Chitinophagales bacterium]
MNVHFFNQPFKKSPFNIFKPQKIHIYLCLLIGVSWLSFDSVQAQVLLNELSPDSGQSDANNDAIVELKNFGGAAADIGCMVVSNSEWITVIPDGTTLAAGGVFLIACGDSNNDGGNHNASNSSNHGLTCDECDFPGLSIDLDVCEADNNDYFTTSVSGFTLDNQNAADGDQVVLFNTDGTIADAVYWGTDGGSSGSADNISVSSDNSHTLATPFTRGNGATNSSQILPNEVANCNAATATSTNAGADATFTFVIPAKSSSEYTDITTIYAADDNASRKGCNSSYVRTPSGSARNLASWTYTHHPTPNNDNGTLTGSGDRPNGTGAPSDSADGYTFFVDLDDGNGFIDVATLTSTDIVLCNPSNVDFRITVENFQHVETRTSIELGVNTLVSENTPPSYPSSSAKMGSYFRDATANTETAWDLTPASGQPDAATGITQLDTNPVALANGETKTFILQWKDYALCCGSGAGNSNRASDQECYENVTLNISVEEGITTVNETEISCSGGTAGQVNIAPQVTDGSDVRYELFFNGVSQGANTTGAFNIPTGATSPITIEVSDNTNCNTTVYNVPINADCIAAPPCPQITNSEVSDCNP